MRVVNRTSVGRHDGIYWNLVHINPRVVLVLLRTQTAVVDIAIRAHVNRKAFSRNLDSRISSFLCKQGLITTETLVVWVEVLERRLSKSVEIEVIFFHVFAL